MGAPCGAFPSYRRTQIVDLLASLSPGNEDQSTEREERNHLGEYAAPGEERLIVLSRAVDREHEQSNRDNQVRDAKTENRCHPKTKVRTEREPHEHGCPAACEPDEPEYCQYISRYQ